MKAVLYIAACVAAGWLLGSFNGAILISRWLRHEDVRTKGSGNAGLTNFYRNYGGADTLLVLLVDVGKTVLACFIGGWILGAYKPEWIKVGQMLCGGCAVLGHMFPVLFRFRGGKGILACGTLAAFMDWRAIVILLGVFILIVALTRFVSLASLICCLAYPFLFWWRFPDNPVLIIMAFCLAALAAGLHHTNISRLLHGKEHKFSFHKKKEETP